MGEPQQISVNGNVVAWHGGMTVQDAMDAMRYDFPLITVLVDGELVDKDDWSDTVLAPGADMKAIHIHHGG